MCDFQVQDAEKHNDLILTDEKAAKIVEVVFHKAFSSESNGPRQCLWPTPDSSVSSLLLPSILILLQGEVLQRM